MATFTAVASGYNEICNVISALRSNGIQAGVTVGGAWVDLSPDQIPLAQEVCKQAGGRLDCGPTEAMQNVLLQSKDGWDSVAQQTNNAIALVKEWEE